MCFVQTSRALFFSLSPSLFRPQEKSRPTLPSSWFLSPFRDVFGFARFRSHLPSVPRRRLGKKIGSVAWVVRSVRSVGSSGACAWVLTVAAHSDPFSLFNLLRAELTALPRSGSGAPVAALPAGKMRKGSRGVARCVEMGAKGSWLRPHGRPESVRYPLPSGTGTVRCGSGM